jgi:hypothetical protein
MLSFAQSEGPCYCCGKSGHKSPECNKKDKNPHNGYAINKMQEAQSKDATQSKLTNNTGKASSLTEQTSRLTS